MKDVIIWKFSPSYSSPLTLRIDLEGAHNNENPSNSELQEVLRLRFDNIEEYIDEKHLLFNCKHAELINDVLFQINGTPVKVYANSSDARCMALARAIIDNKETYKPKFDRSSGYNHYVYDLLSKYLANSASKKKPHPDCKFCQDKSCKLKQKIKLPRKKF